MTPDPSNANGGVVPYAYAQEIDYIDGLSIALQHKPFDQTVKEVLAKNNQFAHTANACRQFPLYTAAPPSPGAGLSEVVPELPSGVIVDAALGPLYDRIQMQTFYVRGYEEARRLGATNAEAVALLCVNDEGCELAIKRRADGRWEFDRDLQGRPLAKMPCCRRPDATPPTGTRGVSEAENEDELRLRTLLNELPLTAHPTTYGAVKRAIARLSAATSGGGEQA